MSPRARIIDNPYREELTMLSSAFHEGRAWIELDMQALRHNVHTLQALLPPGCALMPAVKANAYGHGAVPITKALCELGVKAFCVATAEEGAQLRRHGIDGVILILGYTHPEQFHLICDWDLTQTVIDHAYAVLLNAFGMPLHVHVGIDTGMHRLGTSCENLHEVCGIFKMKNLRIDGIFTHLCMADDRSAEGQALTAAQGRAFWRMIEELQARGLACPGAHLLSSAGLLNYPQLGGAYARVGIALYGVLSTPEEEARCKAQLLPVLSLRARVSLVRQLERGEGAGYGLDFKAPERTKIAVLSIGYADGLPRALSGGVGRVLINGRTAPIVGRICMDQTLVSLDGIPEVCPGDIATLIGTSGQRAISACELALQSGTITNEILSRMGPRLSRVIK